MPCPRSGRGFAFALIRSRRASQKTHCSRSRSSCQIGSREFDPVVLDPVELRLPLGHGKSLGGANQSTFAGTASMIVLMTSLLFEP